MGSGTQHREVVLVQLVALGDGIDSNATGRVQAVDGLMAGVVRAPPGGPRRHAAADRSMFCGLQAEMGCLDAQRGVVGDDARGTVHLLPQRGTDDAVVGQ